MNTRRVMEVVEDTDDRIDVVFQGVRQDENKLAYREGRLKDGAAVKVRATDGRTFTVTEGSYQQGTKFVVVDEPGGALKHL